MRLFNMLGSALGRIMGLLGLGRSDTAASIAAADPAKSQPVSAIVGPAVASWHVRLKVDHFMLARRLASVAKLNTPIGRKPRIANVQTAGAPQLPVSRIGAKQQRIGGNQGLRVLRQAPPQVRPGAAIIPFPTARESGCGRPMRKAA